MLRKKRMLLLSVTIAHPSIKERTNNDLNNKNDLNSKEL